MFPDAPEPFIDLSTGINPHPYPVPELSSALFERLPDRAHVRRLAAVAAQCYGAPSAGHVLPAPGTQILLPQVAMLVSPGRATILRTTYAEHQRAASVAGHGVTEVSSADQLGRADLAVVVNPNNPDGRLVERDTLLDIADELRRRGGILVVDESFADVAPPGATLAGDIGRGNIVVLRSFGKFYGHAGLRLSFALAAPNLVERLDAMLGPWAVAGPALFIGEKALADEAWKLQESYAKSRLVWQLALLITTSIQEATSNSLSSSLTTYSWSAEEEALIRRIVIVLDSIHGLTQQLETLSTPLIDTYKRPSLYPHTSAPNPTATDGGDAPTSKPASPPLPDA